MISTINIFQALCGNSNQTLWEMKLREANDWLDGTVRKSEGGRNRPYWSWRHHLTFQYWFPYTQFKRESYI